MKRTHLLSRSALCGVSALALSLFWTGPAHTAPEGGVIVGGSATITETGKKLDVHQHTDRVVIDWRQFDIEVDEHTEFHQLNSASTALNRVKNNDPSRIMGKLSANGNVILVNPNGVFFGTDSRVDVNSLVATTADVENERFMQLDYKFDKAGNPDAAVINNGIITAKEAGLVGLVAPNVVNNGVIEAKLGTVHLASGDTMVVDLYGNQLLGIAVNDKVKKQLVNNNGIIRADGGTIALTAAAGKEIVDSLVSARGELTAPTVTQKDGKIIIGSAHTTTKVSAKVTAKGNKSGEKGGKIHITGKAVAIKSESLIEVSGNAGGGEVLIGGDYQGKGDTPTAKTTIIEKGSVIKANATEQGDGGKVIVWADDEVDFHGHIEAKGGPLGGNGGFVETSGKITLTSTGSVDAGAVNGQGGQWLLDPTDVTVQGGAGEDISGGGPNTTGSVDAATIQTALNGGTSVTVTTAIGGGDSGDLTLASVSIDKTAGGDATLNLIADRDILTTGTNSITSSSGNNTIYMAAGRNILLSSTALSSSSGAMDVVLNADADADNAGAIRLTNSTIASNGGEVILSGGDNRAAATVLGDLNFLRNTGMAYGVSGELEGIELVSLTTITTDAGNATIRGHGWNDASSDNLYGVRFYTGGRPLTTTTGNVTVYGEGGDGANSNRGVQLQSVGDAIRTETGTINITGRGGLGSGNFNDGIQVTSLTNITSTGVTGAGAIVLNGIGGSGTSNARGMSLASGSINSVSGDVSLTGTVTGPLTSTVNHGIYQYGGFDIISTGTGVDAASITINATGGAGTSSNYGLRLSGSGTTITSVDGDISVTGIGGAGTSTENRGIVLDASAAINSTGTGANAANITLNGTGGASNNSNAFGVDLLSLSSIATVDGDISITGTGGAATTAHFLKGININTASITSTGTGANAGTITLNGTGSNTGGTQNHGIHIAGSAAQIMSVDGAISLTGQGGDGSSSSNYGIYIHNSADIISTGTGANAATITLNGTGGDGTGTDYGVYLDGTGTTLTSDEGNISITGTGGANGNSNTGIYMRNSSQVTSTGTGVDAATITFNGTGGNAANNNYGVRFNGTGTLVTSADGAIDITGLGRGTNGSNFGVYLDTGADITSTGTGANAATITLDGTGGNGTSGNRGVYLTTAGTTISSVEGNIDITGRGGAASIDDNIGINLTSSAVIESTGTGANAANITLNGTGGTGANRSRGITLDNTSNITAIDGDIAITGQGGTASSNFVEGIMLANGAAVRSTGTGAGAGTITLNGTGGTGTGGRGLHLYPGLIETVDGNLTLIGLSDGGSNSETIFLRDGFDINSTGAADITINGSADSSSITFFSTSLMNIGGGAATGDITIIGRPIFNANLASTFLDVQTSGVLTFKPATATTTIGVSGGAGLIDIYESDLSDYFSGYSKLVIGDSVAGSGAIDINSWDLSSATYDVEIYGGSVSFSGGPQLLGAGDFFVGDPTGDLTLTGTINKTAGGNSTFLARAAGNIIADTFAVDATASGSKLHFFLNADSDGNNSGAIRLTDSSIITNGGKVLLSGGNSGQEVGSIADQTYLRDTGRAYGNATEVEGVELDNSDITVSGNGNINIRGKAWDDATSSNLYGIYLHSDSDIASTATGASVADIFLNGIGGNGTSQNYGTYLTGAGTTITSIDGDISIIATGGNGTNQDNIGVEMNSSAAISTTGVGVSAGNITLNGTGGTGTWGKRGVRMEGASSITAADGDISVTGTGTGGFDSNFGIQIANSSTISTTGVDAGDITLLGTGGNGTTLNHGLYMLSSSTLSTTTGTMSITGNAGNSSGSDSYGISIIGSSVITSTGTGAGTGTITLAGTGGNGTSDNYGVYLTDPGTAINSVDGNISITGTGGDGSSNRNYGIYLLDDADIISTGTGSNAATITLNGTGGDGTSNNIGTYITSAGTTVSSQSGAISITGTGDGSSSAYGIQLDTSALITAVDGSIFLTGQGNDISNNNYGMYIYNADITSTGTGADAATITLNGTAGNAQSNNWGIRMEFATTDITSVDGDISITGIGGNGTGLGNTGLVLQSPNIVTTGDANITLNGTAGTTGLSDNIGIEITSNTQISAVNGDVTLTGIGGTSTGANNYGIYLYDSSNITSTGTGTGAGTITLNGTGGAGTTNNYGLYIDDSGTTITSVDGDISITGQGGNGTNSNYGLYYGVGTNIISTGTGANAANITIDATGGGSGALNYGILTEVGSSLIESVDGNIDITGRGSTTATSTFNQGIYWIIGTIRSTGDGNIDLTGIGGDNGTSINYGLSLNTNTISAVDGNITLTGTGGDGSTTNHGVVLTRPSITTTGVGSNVGNITIIGTGQGTGTENKGIKVNTTANPTVITTVDGDIVLTGTSNSTSGANNHGISFEYDSRIYASGNGSITMTGAAASNSSTDISLVADANTVGEGLTAGGITINANSFADAGKGFNTTGRITILPRTAGTSINLGSGTGGLDFSDAELAMLTAGNGITIGDTVNTGMVSIDTSHSFAEDLLIFSGSNYDINLNGTLTSNTAGNAITLVSGRNFINTAGSTALSTPAGRWLVYSLNPNSDSQDDLEADFQRYGCNYGTCSTLDAGLNAYIYHQGVPPIIPEPEPEPEPQPQPEPEPTPTPQPKPELPTPTPTPPKEVELELPNSVDYVVHGGLIDIVKDTTVPTKPAAAPQKEEELLLTPEVNTSSNGKQEILLKEAANNNLWIKLTEPKSGIQLASKLSNEEANTIYLNNPAASALSAYFLVMQERLENFHEGLMKNFLTQEPRNWEEL